MNRTAKQNKQRSKDCAEYRFSVDADCELRECLVADRDAVRWMKGVCLDGNEVHHIFKRGPTEEFEYSCNLILLSIPVHHWVEAHKPAGTILCLHAKYQKYLADVKKIKAAKREMPDAKFMDWNVDVLNRLVRPKVSLAGQISTFMDACGPGRYFDFGLALLNEIENGDLAF